MKLTHLILVLILIVAANHQVTIGQTIFFDPKDFSDQQKPLFQPKAMLQQTDQDFKHFVLEIKSNKKKYLPGELVTLSIKTINYSNQPKMMSRQSVKTGFVKVFIINESGRQMQYFGPGWGLFDGGHVSEILPGNSLETEAVILYNEFRTLEAQSLPQGYALFEPGKYFIKVVMTKAPLSDDTIVQRLESKPIPIEITQPVGPDLLVWQAIRNDSWYAYLFQEKSPMDHEEMTENNQRIEVLNELLILYPNSSYAQLIRQVLPDYKVNIESSKKLREAQLEKP